MAEASISSAQRDSSRKKEKKDRALPRTRRRRRKPEAAGGSAPKADDDGSSMEAVKCASKWVKVTGSRDPMSSEALHPGAGKMMDRSRARYKDGEQGRPGSGDLRLLLPRSRAVFPALASQATSSAPRLAGTSMALPVLDGRVEKFETVALRPEPINPLPQSFVLVPYAGCAFHPTRVAANAIPEVSLRGEVGRIQAGIATWSAGGERSAAILPDSLVEDRFRGEAATGRARADPNGVLYRHPAGSLQHRFRHLTESEGTLRQPPAAEAAWDLVPLQEATGPEPLLDEDEGELMERKRWQEWAKHAAEQERQRRIKILESMDREESRERQARRAWALSALDEEQRRRAAQQFLLSIEATNWFQGTISSLDLDYEIVCPYSSLGCRHICLRTELEEHLSKGCRFNREPEDPESMTQVGANEYEVVCPNTVLGCNHSCPRSCLNDHLERCPFTGQDRTAEKAERERSLQMVLQQAEEERARRVAYEAKGEWQSDSLALKTRQFLHRLLEDQMRKALLLLHKEILDFARRCREIQERRKRALEDVWCRIETVVGELWPDSVVLPYGSWASGMTLPGSDVDLVVCLRPRGGGYPSIQSWKSGAPSIVPRSNGAEEGEAGKGCRGPPVGGSRSAACSGAGEERDGQGTPAPEGSQSRSQFHVMNHSRPLAGERWPGEASQAPQGQIQAPPSREVRVSVEAAAGRTGAPGDSKSSCSGSRSGVCAKTGPWSRRRGWGGTNAARILSRIHDLAGHLRNHAPFVEVVKVLDHARVPIIKAVVASDIGGDDEDSTFNVDISIDGPTHTGLATSAFVSYLADHLPNLVPLTLVLKSLLQSSGLNDPFTGGLPSYGLVLMVVFTILQRDHFPAAAPRSRSFSGGDAAQSVTLESSSEARDAPPDNGEGGMERGKVLSKKCGSEREANDVGPSSEGDDGRSSRLEPTSTPSGSSGCGEKDGASDGTDGRSSPSSLPDAVRANGPRTSVCRLQTIDRLYDPSNSASSRKHTWDRPRQQHWIGARTARAILMQDFYAGGPSPPPPVPPKGHQHQHQHRTSTTDSHARPKVPGGDGTPCFVSPLLPPPPPPPLPQPAEEDDGLCPPFPPRSPHVVSGSESVLGEQLLDFLHIFGEDFDMTREGFSIRGGGFRFMCHDNPPHPQAGDPIVIEDPLNCMNNVGRSSFVIGRVQRAFFEALTTLKATMVRVNQDGKEVLASGNSGPKANTGILRHVCKPPGV